MVDTAKQAIVAAQVYWVVMVDWVILVVVDDLENLAPFKERGYKPVIGGVRHLSGYVKRPTVGRVITLLCGDSYQVSQAGRVPSNADCLACHHERAMQQGRA